MFKERDWKAIRQIAARCGPPAMSLGKFSAWLTDGRVEQRRIGSLEMVAVIRTHLAQGVEPLTVSCAFRDTGYDQAGTQRFYAG